MNDKLTLNKDSLNQYSSLNYENINKYPTYSPSYEYSSHKYQNNPNYHRKKIKNTLEETFDLLNKYRKTRNYDIISNFNKIIYLNEQRKEKKLEFSKSMEKITNSSNDYKLNYIYNNKSLAQINKEIMKFKDKMNSDKTYLNNIQNKIYLQYELSGEGQKRFLNEDIIKNKKRAYSLTNRPIYYQNFTNINKNDNYQYDDYLSEKRKVKNIIINNNNFINNNLIYKKNLNNYQDINTKENEFSKNKIKTHFPKRNNSFYFINNNDIFNKIIFNNSIKKNNYIGKEERDSIKNNKIKNVNNDYEYIRYPERKSIEQKQNDFPNMKYLTIQTKDDKIQLKEKGIKINDISNLNRESINNNYGQTTTKDPKNFTQPNKGKIEKSVSIKYQSKKYDKFINNIINEDSKENNINENNNQKLSLNSDILTNYEYVKKKYNNETNKMNNLPSFVDNNLYRKRSATYIKEDKKSEEKSNTIVNNKLSISNNANSKYFEDINLNSIKKKYSNTIKNEENINLLNSSNTFNKYMISSFNLNIEQNENYNKDLLINNLNDQLLELENKLKIANDKIKKLSEILEKIKKRNKILYIDKINSFNYIHIKNHFKKINKRNLDLNIKKCKNNPILNNEELIIHFSNRSIKGKNKNSYNNIHNNSENEHHSYSSFDNYKNMNLFYTKVTSINEKKLSNIKPSSLSKLPLKYNKNILLNKKNNLKENINIKNKSLFIKDINMNEKIIYTLYFYNDKLNILFFDPELKKFSIQKFQDKGKFEENYKKNLEDINSNKKIGNIFLFNEGFLYAITGKDYNKFYQFNPNTKEINNLCELKYNHSNGNLIYYDQRIFCLSGDFNKKVECYIESKNEWIEIPEMLTERSNFSTCIIKEQYLFALFGYNTNKQYLNSIEFIDLLCENSEWKYLNYENKADLSLFLVDFLGINYDDKKIIIFGGNDGKDNIANQYIYQINLKKNFEDENYDINNDNLTNIVKLDKTMKFNIKNEYSFLDFGYNKYYGDNNNWIYTFFDKELNSHIININDFSHELFNFQ